MNEIQIEWMLFKVNGCDLTIHIHAPIRPRPFHAPTPTRGQLWDAWQLSTSEAEPLVPVSDPRLVRPSDLSSRRLKNKDSINKNIKRKEK